MRARFWRWLQDRLGLTALRETVSIGFAYADRDRVKDEQRRVCDHVTIEQHLERLEDAVSKIAGRFADLGAETQRTALKHETDMLGVLEQAVAARQAVEYLTRMAFGTEPPRARFPVSRPPRDFTHAQRQ
jgi:hypothetical protein